MMVFNVCANETVQLLNIGVNFLVEKFIKSLWWALIDHVTYQDQKSCFPFELCCFSLKPLADISSCFNRW